MGLLGFIFSLFNHRVLQKQWKEQKQIAYHSNRPFLYVEPRLEVMFYDGFNDEWNNFFINIFLTSNLVSLAIIFLTYILNELHGMSMQYAFVNYFERN